PPNATLALVHELGTWISTAEILAVASKSHVSRVRNELQTGGYCVMNLRSSYEWKFVRIDAGIENLLNRFYFNPLGGAYVGQGPSMSTSSIPWGVAVPGPARSFNVALSFKFHS
ncbi:MAG TPA: TonB-dependent receptor, partial [Polyangiaceae bacterium]|nr:TonB-dependent receptor [Polyangiaceae bacterium]